jgi:hypothetical protein
VSVRGNEGEELGKRNGSLAEGKVIPLFGRVVVQVNSDEPRGESAQVLGVLDESEPLFCGGVTKVVPIAEGGSREACEEFIPKVVWWNFTRIFTAFQAEPNS